VTRLLLALALLQQPPATPPPEQEPPEEDESLKPKEYSLNPLQADKEIYVGNFYFKRGNYKGAAARFEEATRWHPGSAEAWMRLGDARDKLNDPAAAREAYEKFLEVAPDHKRAKDVKKKLAALLKEKPKS
jgi:tetratricopeptide (TPR) repeat protein